MKKISIRAQFTASVFLAALSLASCGHSVEAQAPVPDATTLLNVARDYKASTTSTATTSLEIVKADPQDPNYAGYERDLRAELLRGDFDALENESNRVTARKLRVPGGAWKMSFFYEAISYPSADKGRSSSDQEWTSFLNALKQWEKAKPESATAHIGLAAAYYRYGWNARGSGTADTVSSNGWELFDERVGVAGNELAEAAKLQQKSPYWFELMQEIARSQNWTREQQHELFEWAYSFEPAFYMYEWNYAYTILPKWGGEEGEAEAFGKEIADRIGGQQGNFVYWEVASVFSCRCESERDSLSRMSWDRIKKGYADLVQMYGVSDEKANKFAAMAYRMNDKVSAREAFSEIGDEWDSSVWINWTNFEGVREWAERAYPL